MTDSLSPLLQRELDARITTAARTAISQEMRIYRKTHQHWQHSLEGTKSETARDLITQQLYSIRMVLAALAEMGRERFPRQHRRCLACLEIIDGTDPWLCRHHYSMDVDRYEFRGAL